MLGTQKRVPLIYKTTLLSFFLEYLKVLVLRGRGRRGYGRLGELFHLFFLFFNFLSLLLIIFFWS